MATKQKKAETWDLPVRKVSDTLERARTWLIYGRSGSGKTTFSGTFPQRHLYLDIGDEGTDSIADMGDIEVRDIESLEDFEETYWALKNNPKRYDTVTLDTVTRLRQLAMDYVAKKKKRKGNAGEWGSMTKQDYGDVAAYMKEWLKNYRDLAELGIEMVFLAQEKSFNAGEDESEDDQLTPEVAPDVGPSVMKALTAMVSVIGNTFIRTAYEKDKGGKKRRVTQYCLRLGPNPVYITKLRKPKSIEVPDFIVDPTYEDVVDIIEGE